MKSSDYPYGRVTKTLKKAVEWFNRNGKRIIKEYATEHGMRLLTKRECESLSDDLACSFDYPDYLDMPKTVSSRLNSDEVDFLQEEWAELVFHYINMK